MRGNIANFIFILMLLLNNNKNKKTITKTKADLSPVKKITNIEKNNIENKITLLNLKLFT